MPKTFALITALLIVTSLNAQQPEDPLQLSARFVDGVSSKTTCIAQKLNNSSSKALEKLLSRERRIKAKLFKRDSTKAKEVFAGSEQQYAEVNLRINDSIISRQYLPELDTLSTSIKFLEQNQKLLSATTGGKEKLSQALQQLNRLDNKLDKANEVKEFLNHRKQYLTDQLKDLGFARELKKINKQFFYFSEQLHEYKALLKDHKKAERKVLEILTKTKVFQDFMRKNSFLSSLFRMPADPNDPVNMASIAGLQTRAQISTLIQQQIAGAGPGGQQQFTQNMQEAQSQLKQVQEKAMKKANYGGGEIPEGFTPNMQKSKSFLQRLEYGTNMQTQKASNFFPVTSDIGLSAGYKINDKSMVGIGVSYKVGWGSGWKNINITNQGLGLRSFIDWKIKGSFWMSGGYEQNYKTAFRNIDQLKDHSAWQQSGLVGLSKIVSLKTKFFKKTKLQLLWDFLSYQQVPVTQPVIFRIGYNF